jgi:sec-independent protein translocase protein TatA
MFPKIILMGVSGGEIVVVFLFVLMFFGSKQIPQVARSLGKGMKEFKKAADEIKREINISGEGLLDDIRDVKNGIQKDIQQMVNADETVKSMQDITKDIKKDIDDQIKIDPL